jgi:hypothetical protein
MRCCRGDAQGQDGQRAAQDGSGCHMSFVQGYSSVVAWIAGEPAWTGHDRCPAADEFAARRSAVNANCPGTEPCLDGGLPAWRHGPQARDRVAATFLRLCGPDPADRHCREVAETVADGVWLTGMVKMGGRFQALISAEPSASLDPKLPDGSPACLPDSGHSSDHRCRIALGHRFDVCQPPLALRAPTAVRKRHFDLRCRTHGDGKVRPATTGPLFASEHRQPLPGSAAK